MIKCCSFYLKDDRQLGYYTLYRMFIGQYMDISTLNL